MTDEERTIIRQAKEINKLLEELEVLAKDIVYKTRAIATLERGARHLRDRMVKLGVEV